MEKHRAIPKGYMTVGEVAKKMGTTVRTLQYYDKEGILSPSAESEGGRRLYSDKDVVKLHQVLSMKSLGFSLDDIKNRLMSLDTPNQVAEALASQAEAIRAKMATLLESLDAIETLKMEVLQIQSVDFSKYAAIITNLQLKNEAYWMIKHFNSKTLEHFELHFDDEHGQGELHRLDLLWNEAIRLQKENISPDSDPGLAIAKQFWDTVTRFTNGNPEVLDDMIRTGMHIASQDEKWAEKHAQAHEFLNPALEAYFKRINYNPYNPYTEDSK